MNGEIGIKTDSIEGELDDNKRELALHFPLLKKNGRALINLENNTLVEFYPAPEGHAEAVEGNSIYSQNDRGFDYGHIVVEQWMAYRVSDCPVPNQNGEIPVLNSRPSKSELTHKSPQNFRGDVLEKHGQTPFILVERPQITYEEAVLGETYEVLGWYDYRQSDPDARLRSIDEMADEFDFNTKDGLTQAERGQKELAVEDLGVSVDWDSVDDAESVNVRFAAQDRELVAEVTTEQGEVHLGDSFVTDYGSRDIQVDSPYEARKYIKQDESASHDVDDLGWDIAHPTWNNSAEAWEIDFRGDQDALNAADLPFDTTVSYAIYHLVRHGFDVTLDGADFERLAVDTYTYTEAGPIGTDAVAPDDELTTYGSVADTDSDFDIVNQRYRGETPDATAQANRARGSFVALDASLSQSAAAGAAIEGFNTLTNLPEYVAEQWVVSDNPHLDDEDAEETVYAWYNPETGARIRITPVVAADADHDVWGGELLADVSDRDDIDGDTAPGEFGIHVKEPYHDEEQVASLASEQVAVQTVVTHMQALSR